ncbi:hypothetical protein AXG93_1200s1840 [Marchantia polymorpha subsp. ruderalis]|uniref:HTH CENPB-type domain-containing protein n=1 Tax=Marchantia polymorpha subsp. ruderalis TaxID=1480154 RepID=A0A176WLZ2_MARPO|nr:hypothetical protein AXG93_1200s1840 [Marchantia polymorpha subsp. ruderalis]
MSGDIIKEKDAYFLAELYPGYEAFEFSNGWLEAFKNRHTIKSYRRFGESGSVNMALIEESLPQIRFNSGSDKVSDPEKINVLEAMRIAVAAWSMDSLIDPDVIKDLEEQVQELRYRNSIDICNLIDYPTERKVAYVPNEEEIVQELSINLVLEDEVEADDSQEYILVKISEAMQCASLLQ